MFGLFKKNDNETNYGNASEQPKSMRSSVKRGNVTTYPLVLDNDVVYDLSQRFIAFDIETTGLYPYKDSIVEIGAVLFENGLPVEHYDQLINIGKKMPRGYKSPTGITSSDLAKAPSEAEVLDEFVGLLGDALDRYTIMAGYNASYQMGFLTEALMRNGYDGEIDYVDIQQVCKDMKLQANMESMDSVADVLGIGRDAQKDSAANAETTGRILCALMQDMGSITEAAAPEDEVFPDFAGAKQNPYQESVINEVMESFPKLTEEQEMEIAKVQSPSPSPVLQAQPIVPQPVSESVQSVPIIKLEPEPEMVRPEPIFEARQVQRPIVEAAAWKKPEAIPAPMGARVPLARIRNLNNLNKGYREGFGYFREGERARLAEDYKEAIKSYDKARENGFLTVVLYESYGLAFHALRDYLDEEQILAEGIDRLKELGVDTRRLVARMRIAGQLRLIQGNPQH